jgi:hypothetical protein
VTNLNKKANIAPHDRMKATILPIFANVEWPSAAVAIAIILVLGVVIAIVVARFTMDEVLKLWTAAGPTVCRDCGTRRWNSWVN